MGGAGGARSGRPRGRAGEIAAAGGRRPAARGPARESGRRDRGPRAAQGPAASRAGEIAGAGRPAASRSGHENVHASRPPPVEVAKRGREPARLGPHPPSPRDHALPRREAGTETQPPPSPTGGFGGGDEPAHGPAASREPRRRTVRPRAGSRAGARSGRSRESRRRTPGRTARDSRPWIPRRCSPASPPTGWPWPTPPTGISTGPWTPVRSGRSASWSATWGQCTAGRAPWWAPGASGSPGPGRTRPLRTTRRCCAGTGLASTSW